MGQTEFLSLLVTQMRNQDPLKPVSDTEFIAQMAQFTSLEQTKEMGADLQQPASTTSPSTAIWQTREGRHR